MKNNKKKIYICKCCKSESGVVGIMQKEIHYYKFYLDTNQWEDFCGDDDVEDQTFFCLKCNKKIDDAELE
jgi:hypothetical protein